MELIPGFILSPNVKTFETTLILVKPKFSYTYLG